MEESFEWERATPESQYMSGSRLDAMRDELERRGTKTLLIVRNDRIIYEWYAPDFGPGEQHYTASLAKALVGGLSLMLALDDGLLEVDDLACKYVPAWKDDPLKSRITVRHLATHSSGIEDAEQHPPGGRENRRGRRPHRPANLTKHHMELPGWKGEFWRRDPNPFLNARDDAPVLFEPGSDVAYSNPGMAMLAYVVTAALKDGPHKDIRTLLRERIMRPIGVADEEWSIGYGETHETDGLPLVANWGGANFTARAVARVGRLMLSKGNWQGRLLISPEWVEKVTEYAGTPVPDRSAGTPGPGSGLCWWLNFDGVFRSLPRDAFWGSGAGNQVLLVSPILELIVVRNGSQLTDDHLQGIAEFLFEPLAGAILPPCPPSPVIAGIEWAPSARIMRQCYMRGTDGSDNWPCTWADDDALYTAWGDGWGFERGVVPEKLSMGVSKVVGDPPEHVGENVRSNAEFAGMGRRGKKASGMLMVEGVLYMWVRNANGDGKHCQLGRSRDHGQSWNWADWKFEELGYCTFLNFGKNYAGAHDDYVYVYSHDHPSAYVAADRMILARVPKDAVTTRDAYEFFTGLDQEGRPCWSADIAERGAVFTHKHRCLRSGVSYDAGLGRYLWWHQLPNHMTDPRTRFYGGFAVYDAPEPWGPWTNVYYTKLWDVGPGETGCFPTKWMSEDGTNVHLVFSGNDTFAVREGTLIRSESAARA